VRRGELDAVQIPRAPLDVLSQHIVAEVCSREWSEDALYERFRQAAPYAALEREQFDAVLKMLAEGFTTRHGTRAAYIHRDAVNGTLRGRRGGKLYAVTSGGTIPENADYSVILEPQAVQVGTVNEDFAVESLAGDVFQLGNASYRILRVESGRVRVEDAHGQPPNIPFWLGEAPGRSDELSFGVARLRREIEQMVAGDDAGSDGDLPSDAAAQIVARATGSKPAARRRHANEAVAAVSAAVHASDEAHLSVRESSAETAVAERPRAHRGARRSQAAGVPLEDVTEGRA